MGPCKIRQRCFKTLMRILTRLEFSLDLCPIFKLVVRSIGTFSKDLAMPVRHIVLISFLKHLHQRIHNLKAFGSAHLTNLFNYISHTCTYYNKKTSNPADDLRPATVDGKQGRSGYPRAAAAGGTHPTFLSSSAEGRSLVAEAVDWIQLRGAVGGIEAEEETDERRDHEGVHRA